MIFQIAYYPPCPVELSVSILHTLEAIIADAISSFKITNVSSYEK